MTERRRLALALIAVPLLVYLGVRFALAHSLVPRGLASLWLPNGVVLGGLLLLRGRGSLALLGLAFGAEVLAGRPGFSLGPTAVMALIHTGAAALTYWLLRRWNFSLTFATVDDLYKFFIAGPVAGALPGAVLEAAVYGTVQGAAADFQGLLRVLWFSHGVALLVVTPLVLSLEPRPHTPRPGSWGRRADVLTALGGVVVVGLFLATGTDGAGGLTVAPGLLLPFILYVAARFDVRWTGVALGLMALLLVTLLGRGYALFGDVAPNQAVLEVQRFIFVLAVMGLGLAALLGQLHTRQAALAASNERLNLLNRDLEAHVAQRTAELRALNATLLEMAQTDSLTGLLNRRAFLTVAARELERSRRHNRPVALMMIDLDYFKEINDRHGHQAGDLVLHRTAALLAGAVRVSDTLARYGGEEFVLLAPETDQASALSLAGRIQQALREQAIELDGNSSVTVTASIGLALYSPAHDTSLDSWLRRADGALYAAKHQGRDTMVLLEAAEAEPRN